MKMPQKTWSTALARSALLLALAMAGAWAPAAQAAMAVDSARQLKLLGEGQPPPLLIGDAHFRVGVFAYDDPGKLGLSEPLAALAASEVLVGSPVSSLGVLRFSDPMAGPPLPELGYFDRIDRLADAQKVTLSIWGVVRQDGGELVVDTYLQIPQPTVELALQVRLRLPRAMGGGELLARIGSDRVLLQRRVLQPSAVAELKAAAARLGELRDEPRDAAPVVRRLPPETVYYLRRVQAPWVLVGAQGGGGWVRSAGHCTGDCAPLLDGPRFVASLLGFIEKRSPLRASDTLHPEARAFADQARAMAAINQPGYDDAGREAAAILARWVVKGGNASAAMPPTGAGSANLRLVALLSGEMKKTLNQQGGGDYDSLAIDRSYVQFLAREAADALQYDPRNAELLSNLAVLWAYIGDTRRATLARQLVEEAQGSGRLRLLPGR